MQEIQAAFIDRDGTIGGTGHFVHPTEFSLFDGAQGAIDMLKQAGIKVFAFTTNIEFRGVKPSSRSLERNSSSMVSTMPSSVLMALRIIAIARSRNQAWSRKRQLNMVLICQSAW